MSTISIAVFPFRDLEVSPQQVHCIVVFVEWGWTWKSGTEHSMLCARKAGSNVLVFSSMTGGKAGLKAVDLCIIL